jgi:hypothetical protein
MSTTIWLFLQQIWHCILGFGKHTLTQMDSAFDRDLQGFIVNALIIFIIVILLSVLTSHRRR